MTARIDAAIGDISAETFAPLEQELTTLFSVGGDSGDVDAIANRFSPGWFDGMTDSYQYKTSPWSDTFGSAKYISTSRNYSLAMIEPAIAALVAEYGDKNAVTAEQYNNGDGYNTSPIEGAGYGAHSWQSLINLTLSEMEG